MDEDYDVIVLGTGLKECIISGICSTKEMKVLHMDRNDYYGGESASMNPLSMLYKINGRKFEEAHPELRKTRARDWNVDLIPKLIMAKGELVKILISTDVTRYLEFKQTSDSYVFKKGGKICKVPSNETEALTSSLLGMLEKRRFRNLLIYVSKYNGGVMDKIDPEKMSGKQFFEKFGIDNNTQEFVGHALALYTDDSYLTDQAVDVINKIKLYFDSLTQYGTSPFLFTLYGLGELPQGFARLSAIHGGTYMLNKPIEEIVYNEDNEVCGVKSEGKIAKCKAVVCDPSYVKDMVKVTGQVVRCICLLKENTFPKSGSKLTGSFQLIMPGRQIGFKNDIYIVMLTSELKVCPEGFAIAIISKKVETSKPESELQEAFQLMPEMLDSFLNVVDMYEPMPEAEGKRIYISTSYDATSHFQTTVWDVKAVIKRMKIDFDSLVANVKVENLEKN